MLQLQLLTKRNDPAPAQTWGQDAAAVLAGAFEPSQARRLQNVLKVLLKPGSAPAELGSPSEKSPRKRAFLMAQVPDALARLMRATGCSHCRRSTSRRGRGGVASQSLSTRRRKGGVASASNQ